jgi:hypothetical protein
MPIGVSGPQPNRKDVDDLEAPSARALTGHKGGINRSGNWDLQCCEYGSGEDCARLWCERLQEAIGKQGNQTHC